MNEFLYRLSLIIGFQVYIWLFFRKRLIMPSESSNIKRLVIHFAVLYGLFSFVYINFIAHFGVMRFSPDTPYFVKWFYSEGVIYGQAPGASIIIILVIKLSLLSDPFAAVQYTFSLVLPILLFIASYHFFEEIINPKEAFTAAMILVQIDIIIDHFTGNVKQEIAIILLLVTLKFLIKYKDYETKPKIGTYEFPYSILCLVSSIIIFCTHLITFLVSLVIIPVLLVKWNIEDDKIFINPSKDVFVWSSASFLFPIIYGRIIDPAIETNAIPAQLVGRLTEKWAFSGLFILGAFSISCIIILLLYCMCWFWSDTSRKQIYVNSPYLLVPLIFACFMVYSIINSKLVRLWYINKYGYFLLSIPRIMLLTLSFIFILNINIGQKTLLSSADISEAFNTGIKKKSFVMLSLTTVLLFSFGVLFVLFSITGYNLGQLERRWLDFYWIPISWMASRLIVLYESNEHKLANTILSVLVIFLCSLSMLLGSKDLFFFNPTIWNINALETVTADLQQVFTF